MISKNNLVCSLLCFLALVSLSGADAQTPADSIKKSLATLTQTVHLDLEGATVKQALKELSAQCKMKILAADYLEDRILSLHLGSISAGDALDTIAEGNDWIWYAENDTTIRITHRSVPTPRDLSELPAAFKAALPKDMRRYLGYDASPLDLMPEDKRKEFEQRKTDLSRNPRMKAFEEQSVHSTMPHNLSARIYAARMKQQKPFEQLINMETRNRVKIPYAELTTDQKQALVRLMVCAALQPLNSYEATFQLLHYPIPPEMLDATRTVIGVKGNRIQLGPFLYGRIYGYDEGLQSERALGDPLRLDPNRY